MKPTRFGAYWLTERLGRGSMNEVFLAVRAEGDSSRLFVVKRPPLGERTSGEKAEAIRREGRAVRAIGPAVAPQWVAEDELGGLPYLVLEYRGGATLEALLARPDWDRRFCRVLAARLAEALAGVHAAGWVHGDLSPSNVIVDEDGEVGLIDFGLAEPVGGARAAPSGSPGYASAEAARGEPVSPADDVFAWGAIVAEMALGRPLFDDVDLTSALARPADLPSSLSEIPWVREALATDPKARPTALTLASIARPEDQGPSAEWLERRPAPGEGPSGSPEAPSSAVASPRAGTSQAEARRASSTVRATTSAGGGSTMTAPSAVTASDGSPSRSVEPGRSRSTIGLLVFSLAVGMTLGAVIGRRLMVRSQSTSLLLPSVDARVDVELDGTHLLGADGDRPIPIEPGEHTLSIQWGKREPETFEFRARPGEQVVILSISPAAKADVRGGADIPSKSVKNKGKKNNP